jgi:hypothetical protein
MAELDLDLPDAEVDALLQRMNIPAPRTRWFQRGRGPMFFWTTEPEAFGTRYLSGVCKPVGKGVRSGNAEEWELDPDSISRHRLRKDAKARALRLYQESGGGRR